MNHSERAERRRKIAVYVQQHDGDISKAAVKFKVTESTVKSACLEHGVETRNRVRRQGTTIYTIIADLQKGGTVADIANKLNVSKQRISLARKTCLEHGIVLKVSRSGG
jgi:transposase